MRRSAWFATCSLLAATAFPVVAPAPADAKTPPRPRLAAKVGTVPENAGKAVVRLTLPVKAKRTVRITWHTKDGTAKAGADYTRATGTTTIRKGTRTATLSVRVLSDAVRESAERFAVVLSSRQARVPARPVVVTLRDTTPASPSALDGTVTAELPGFVMQQPTTVTLKVHLVPTGTAGEWRDDGTGWWSVEGALYSPSPVCAFPMQVPVHGSGPFLTGAGTPTTGQAALVLSGFDPVGATGTPSLTWSGITSATSYRYDMAPVCDPTPIPTTVDYFFTLASPGAPGTYNGATSPTRGVTFDYDVPEIATVTGTLTAVP